MKRLTCCIIFAGLFISACLHPALAQTPKLFKTKYAKIHYSDDKDLDLFFWRLGGQRLEFPKDAALASNRVDRIVERVEAILDMRPKNFSVDIALRRGMLDGGRAAFYDRRTRSIYISADYATDGVAAHEIAHAVIERYFAVPPSNKAQEILTQYVDKYLWNDY